MSTDYYLLPGPILLQASSAPLIANDAKEQKYPINSYYVKICAFWAGRRPSVPGVSLRAVKRG
jgi:hypothetical protein